MMLLEAILRHIHDISVDMHVVRPDIALDTLLNVLHDALPNDPKNPDNILCLWKPNEGIFYVFEYSKEGRCVEYSFEELYQYFCTVLGEEKE